MLEMFELLLAWYQQDWKTSLWTKFTAVGVIALLLVISTYIFTSLRFFSYAYLQNGNRKTPPTLPYWIPFIGHTITMTRNGHRLYEAAAMAHPGRITGVHIADMYCYIVSGGDNINKVLRSSRVQEMGPVFLEITRKCLNLPQADFEILAADTSGHHKTPLTDIPEEKRIMRRGHLVQETLTKGTETLESLTRIFNREFQLVMNERDIGKEWETILLHKFSTRNMSHAVERTMLGRSIFKHCPTISEDFWVFLDGLIKLFMGVPRFMCREIHASRDRLVSGWEKHLNEVEDRYEDIVKADPEWEPELGSRVFRAQDAVSRDCGISVRGRAGLVAGAMIGMQGNTVPVTSWILIELVRDPELLATVRQEIETALLSSEDTKEIIWDISKLNELPVFNSVVTESLRLRVSNNPNRRLTADLEVGGYVLKAGNQVMLPNWIPHIHDPIWTEIDVLPNAHPTDKFWAQRFLTTDPKTGELTNIRPKAGTYFPFGGGATICPGRFIARHELLTSIAFMVWKYDIEAIEIVDKKGRARNGELGYDRAGAGFGALHPDGDLKCRIRRRS